MVKNFTGRRSSFVSFRRTKPGLGSGNHHLTARISATHRLTQFAFGAISSGTLIHLSDPSWIFILQWKPRTSLFVCYRAPVQLNVFNYDESSCTEGKYKKVEEIPNVPLGSTSPMLCKYEIRIMSLLPLYWNKRTENVLGYWHFDIMNSCFFFFFRDWCRWCSSTWNHRSIR